jgi:hypothetical protein
MSGNDRLQTTALVATDSLLTPAGSWLWVWDLPSALNGDIAAYVACAKQHNVTGFYLKMFDGEWLDGWWARNQVPAFVQTCRNAGLGVAGWYYSVSDWTGAAATMQRPRFPTANRVDLHQCTMEQELDNLARCVALRPDFMIIDIEKEWCRIPDKRPDPDGHARHYGQALRQRFPSFPIYAAPVPATTGYWDGNPLATIATFVDGMLPQVYCWLWDVPGDVASWTQRAHDLSYGKPCFPIYDLANDGGMAAPADYLRAALTAAGAAGGSGVSWWDAQVTQAATWPMIEDAGRQFPVGPTPDPNWQDPQARFYPQTGAWLHGGFRRYYDALPDALQRFGYPVTNELQEQGLTVQYFERARFEWHRDEADEIQLGRVGAELAQTKGLLR